MCYYGNKPDTKWNDPLPMNQLSNSQEMGIVASNNSPSHDLDEDITPHTTRHKYVSSCGQYIYHLAIIDYLQTFNFEKKSESRLKIWILRRPAHLISAVEPKAYGDRFIKFMTQEVLIDSNLINKDIDGILQMDDKSQS